MNIPLHHHTNSNTTITLLNYKSPLLFITQHQNLLSSSSSYTQKRKIEKMAPIRISPLSAKRTISMVQRHNFNTMARIRQSVRSFEPHPFERYPVATKAAPADWGKQVRRVGDAALLYVSFISPLCSREKWKVLMVFGKVLTLM